MTSEGMRYRIATRADAAAMAACRLTDSAAGPPDSRMAAYFEGQHHPQKALPPRVGYVASTGETVVAYIAGHLTTRYGCDGEVQYLFVAPQHRRQGVATALLRLLADWFRKVGAKRVCVNVDVDSPAATPFYESLGASPLIGRFWYVWDDISVLCRQEPLSGDPAIDD